MSQAGTVKGFGDGVAFFGASPPHPDALAGSFVGIETNSRGYWLVATDGSVFAYQGAGFHGSMGNRHLNAPVVAMTATPDGNGYWLVAADGGVFAFGDATFAGSTGHVAITDPFVGIAAS